MVNSPLAILKLNRLVLGGHVSAVEQFVGLDIVPPSAYPTSPTVSTAAPSVGISGLSISSLPSDTGDHDPLPKPSAVNLHNLLLGFAFEEHHVRPTLSIKSTPQRMGLQRNITETWYRVILGDHIDGDARNVLRII